LKEARRKTDLTQDELAKRAGITQMHYSAIERGNKNPSVDTLDAILHALNLRIEDVWTSDPNPLQPSEAAPESPGADRKTA
jgi:transcriptional regulator with XRE-family HTH domain